MTSVWGGLPFTTLVCPTCGIDVFLPEMAAPDGTPNTHTQSLPRSAPTGTKCVDHLNLTAGLSPRSIHGKYNRPGSAPSLRQQQHYLQIVDQVSARPATS